MLLPPHVGGGLIWGIERASGTVVAAAAACFVVCIVCWVMVMSKTLLGVFFVGVSCGGCTSDWCSFILRDRYMGSSCVWLYH